MDKHISKINLKETIMCIDFIRNLFLSDLKLRIVESKNTQDCVSYTYKCTYNVLYFSKDSSRMDIILKKRNSYFLKPTVVLLE